MIWVVGLGAGSPESVPAVAADRRRAGRPACWRPPLAPELLAAAGAGGARAARRPGAPCPTARLIAAPDAEAHRIARAPAGGAHPARTARPCARGRSAPRWRPSPRSGLRLRRECPWDRVQTAETIVPHTIEEAFEVADAVASGGAGLADELGDLLFQSVFLAQLLEEEGGADLGAVARGQADKLISRHPHVYGERRRRVGGRRGGRVGARASARSAPTRAMFHELPAGLPVAGLRHQGPEARRRGGLRLPRRGRRPRQARRGDRRAARGARAPASWATCCSPRSAPRAPSGADPELALRASAQRFRER